IQIGELRGGPIDLRGAIAPDLAAHRTTVDLAGTIAVDEALLHALGAPASIRAANGAVAIEQLRAELPAPGEDRARYTLRAPLAGGSLRIESDAMAETLTGIDVRLTGDDAVLRGEGRGIGAALGPLTANAELDLAMGRTRGDVTLAQPSAQFLRDPHAQEHL